MNTVRHELGTYEKECRNATKLTFFLRFSAFSLTFSLLRKTTYVERVRNKKKKEIPHGIQVIIINFHLFFFFAFVPFSLPSSPFFFAIFALFHVKFFNFLVHFFVFVLLFVFLRRRRVAGGLHCRHFVLFSIIVVNSSYLGHTIFFDHHFDAVLPLFCSSFSIKRTARHVVTWYSKKTSSIIMKMGAVLQVVFRLLVSSLRFAQITTSFGNFHLFTHLATGY